MHFLPLSSYLVQVAHTRFDRALRRAAASQTNSKWIWANVTQRGHPATCGVTCSHLTHKPVQYKLTDRLLTRRFKGRGRKKNHNRGLKGAGRQQNTWQSLMKRRKDIVKGSVQVERTSVQWGRVRSSHPRPPHLVVLLSVTLEAVFCFYYLINVEWKQGIGRFVSDFRGKIWHKGKFVLAAMENFCLNLQWANLDFLSYGNIHIFQNESNLSSCFSILWVVMGPLPGSHDYPAELLPLMCGNHKVTMFLLWFQIKHAAFRSCSERSPCCSQIK